MFYIFICLNDAATHFCLIMIGKKIVIST